MGMWETLSVFQWLWQGCVWLSAARHLWFPNWIMLSDLRLSPRAPTSIRTLIERFYARCSMSLPGYRRYFEPSNFWAINLRYRARIVSGLAT